MWAPRTNRRWSTRATAARVWVVWAALWVAVGAAALAADPPSWDELRALYDYDANAPLEVEEGERVEGTQATVQRLSFASPRGGRVPAVLGIPRQGQAPYPALILLHGYGGQKDDWLPFLDVVCGNGWAAIAIDAVYHGERAEAGKNILSGDAAADRDAFIQTIIDQRRAVDYLASRDDINVDRVGLLGASMGAIMGTITAGVEPRIKCAVLAVGGGDWRFLVENSSLPPVVALNERLAGRWAEVEQVLASIEPLNFAPHIAPRPVLMLNGKNDTVVIPESSERLYGALGEPKEIKWFESGHGLPIFEAWAAAALWLETHL